MTDPLEMQKMIKIAADQAVDLSWNGLPPEMRKKAVTDMATEVISEIPGLGPTAAPSALPRLSNAAEALLQEHNEPPHSAITIRQDIRDLPENAQAMWLQTYYQAKDYAEKNPGMTKEYPVNTAWKAVNTDFQKTDLGWVPRTTASIKKHAVVDVVEVPGGGYTIKPRDEEEAKFELPATTREQVEELLEKYELTPSTLPWQVTPKEEIPGATKQLMEPSPVEKPEVVGESPPGRPRHFEITPEKLSESFERIRTLALKPDITDVEQQEAQGLIDDVLMSGYKFKEEDWRIIREKGFEALGKKPEELLEVTKKEPETLMDHLERSIAVGRLISFIEDPEASTEDRAQAESALEGIIRKNPEILRAVEKQITEPRKQEIAKRQWEQWITEEIGRLTDTLKDPLMDESFKENARKALGKLTAKASINNEGEAFIKAAQEERDMPRIAKVEFDAKTGKYNVLHANFLKPLSFASKDEAEDVAKTLDPNGAPKVTKEGETFKVSHPDWSTPVEAKGTDEAQQVVEQKLRELGDPEEQAKEEAKEIVETSVKAQAQTVTEPEKTGETKEQTPGGEQKMDQGGEKVEVTADVKQVSPGSPDKKLVSGLPDTDVSAGSSGKHPNTKGVVSTEKGDPGTIEKSKPGSSALRSDQSKKFDGEVQKVQRSYGLTREMQKLCSTEAGCDIVEKALKTAKLESALAPVKAAQMTEEARKFVSDKISMLADEGKDPQDPQTVAIAYSKAREAGYEVPEQK